MDGSLIYRRSICLVWWLSIVFGLALLSNANAKNYRTYTVSVVPQSTGLDIHARWTPIIDYLSEKTGAGFKLKQYKSIPAFESGILKGEVDFAYMNPYHCVMANHAQGFIPLVRSGSKMLVGILVVPSNSPINNVYMLDGKKLAFPAPNAFGASLYMRALLTEKEKITVTPNYVTTHDNVYRHVLLGMATAGGGVARTLGQQPDDIKTQLRILYKTPGVAPHPLAVHPRVPLIVRQSITKAFMALPQHKNGQAMLASIPMHQPIIAEYQKDYGILENLHLEKYLVHE